MSRRNISRIAAPVALLLAALAFVLAVQRLFPKTDPLTVLIGISLAYVAYQQYRTAREKFKLDLFDKRFAVFSGARKFLTVIGRDANFDLDALWEYRAAIAEADFLFGDDITRYVWEIDRHALNLQRLRDTMQPLPVGEDRSRLAREHSEELTWLTGQLPELKPRFGRYMKFAEWN